MISGSSWFFLSLSPLNVNEFKEDLKRNWFLCKRKRKENYHFFLFNLNCLVYGVHASTFHSSKVRNCSYFIKFCSGSALQFWRLLKIKGENNLWTTSLLHDFAIYICYWCYWEFMDEIILFHLSRNDMSFQGIFGIICIPKRTICTNHLSQLVIKTEVMWWTYIKNGCGFLWGLLWSSHGISFQHPLRNFFCFVESRAHAIHQLINWIEVYLCKIQRSQCEIWNTKWE